MNLPENNYKERNRANRYQERLDFKYDLDRHFVKQVGTRTLIDAYAGNSNRYIRMKIEAMTNDLDTQYETNYHLPADRFLNLLHGSGMTADVVDLDPYDSCWICLPTAVKLANKGLIVTYTDFENWRYKRSKVILSQVGLNPDSWKAYREALIYATIDIGETFGKKRLKPVYLFEPISSYLRVYFTITILK